MTNAETPSATSDDLKARARHEYDDARGRLHDSAHRLRSEGGATLLNTVTDELERRKSGFAEELRGLSDTLHKASREQTEKDGGTAPSGLLGYGADLIDDLNSGIEGRSVTEIGNSVAGYARANPALFVGGCLLAGLALGRLLTASTPATPRPSYAPDASRSSYPTDPVRPAYPADDMPKPMPNAGVAAATGAAAATPSYASQTDAEAPQSPFVLRKEDDNVGN